jgi:hypothetical protein
MFELKMKISEIVYSSLKSQEDRRRWLGAQGKRMNII